MASVTVRNDTVTMVNNALAYYDATNDAIYLKKGEISKADFGLENEGAEGALSMVHERQHQINAHKGVGLANVSLAENYQRNVHNEITALMAEKLEFRRQYKLCQTDDERKELLGRFAQNEQVADYIQAIQSGVINPNGSSRSEFLKEMTFIKDSSIKYRADPLDSAYRNMWMQNTCAFLSAKGNAVRSNPAALKYEVQEMYKIGGFDFNTVGRQDIYVIENQSVAAADNLLLQGAAPEKVVAFLQQGDSAFGLAETLDVSGLNEKQAEKVLQTAFMSQTLADDICCSLALGQDMNFDYNYIARDNRVKMAMYLDMKADIWRKNHTLTEKGDEVKFNALMKRAQEVNLDMKGWFDKSAGNLNVVRDPALADELAAVKKRVSKFQGQTFNCCEHIEHWDEYLPMTQVSKEQVLAMEAAEKAENEQFWTKYYQSHPIPQKRLSDAYQVEIMDLGSDILKDELTWRGEQEANVEALYLDNRLKQYNYVDGSVINFPALSGFRRAEIATTVQEDGMITQVAIVDGQKHGAEIQKNKNGEVVGLKVYNHGQQVELSSDIRLCNEKQDGWNRTYLLWDGQRFGAELVTDPNGNMKAAFFDKGGVLIQAKEESEITKAEKRLDLKAEMKGDVQKASSIDYCQTRLSRPSSVKEASNTGSGYKTADRQQMLGAIRRSREKSL